MHHALNEWWHESKSIDRPAAVVGFEGAGKTWATLDWLVENMDSQPIVLCIPSTAITPIARDSIGSVKQLLAESIHDLLGVCDQQHWLRRLDRLLSRPRHEGPVLTVFFDGLNQSPSVAWPKRLMILQGHHFSDRCRVLLSTRHYDYTNNLLSLRSLVESAARIDVTRFDKAPGGELDQMLQLHGLTRAQLQPAVLELARTARLFKLIARLKDNLLHADQVTVHRLLWEYGRDTFGLRGDTSFSPDEWYEWLREIATRYRAGTRAYTHRSLGKTVDRPDLTEIDVAARLSDIVDGRLVTRTDSGDLQPDPLIVTHALGAALLNHLLDTSPAFDQLSAKLTDWLDPISGYDQRAEILRAALAISISQTQEPSRPLSSVLLTSWLQSQNVPMDHQSELNALAATLLDPLLDTIEHSDSRALTATQHLGARAIRSIPRSDRAALTKIVARATVWLSTVSRDIDTRRDADLDHERRRHERFISRIGRDSSGPIVVAAIHLRLVDQSLSALPALVPKLLDGFPLAAAAPVFETAAASMAIAGNNPAWRGLKWLCLLNQLDPRETTLSVRRLSDDIRLRVPEPGVRHDFPARVAALLLWLTGHTRDDVAANSIDPAFYHPFTYNPHYLAHPPTSFFPLEHRHVKITLEQSTLRLDFRIQRTKQFLLDPKFTPPSSFVSELHEAAKSIDVTKLNRKPARTFEDHVFEHVALGLAQCDESSLAHVIRRKLRSMTSCPPHSRYWAAIHATDHVLFCDSPEADAARTLRLSAKEPREAEETLASTTLLLLECADPHATAAKQIATLINAPLDFIASDFADVLRKPSADDIHDLITIYRAADFPQQRRLLIVLSLKEVSVTDASWQWIKGFAKHPDSEVRGAAFKILADADPVRFGNALLAEDWSWRPDEEWWTNDHGTRALVEATFSLCFSRLCQLIAPWRLLYAARRRGAKPEEVKLAAKLFGRVLFTASLSEPVTHSDLSVDRTIDRHFPFVISIAPRPPEDQVQNLRLAFDGEAQARNHQRAFDTTLEFMNETRHSGFYFYLVDFRVADFWSVVQIAPECVDEWIEGCAEITEEFQRRVWYAEGAYLSLCEALLVHDPGRGSRLWRALRVSLKIRFVGECGIDELTHIAFRAPETADVAKVRSELLDLSSCNTDRALFDLATAACYNEKSDWLSEVIDVDRKSQLPWRIKRAETIAGFTVNNTLPIDGTWLEGEVATDDLSIACRSARSRWMEACARHWWEVFVATSDPVTAYAAWVLFLQSADRRTQAWVSRGELSVDDRGNLLRLKALQYQLNQDILKKRLRNVMRNSRRRS